MDKDIKYYMNLNYAVEIRKLTEDQGGGYNASIPQLGRYTFQADGESVEEVLNNLEIIKEELFELFLSRGTKIPEPIVESNEEYSGKFLMRVPKNLHRMLSLSAKQNGTSLNQYVQFLLTSATISENYENILNNYCEKFDNLLANYKKVDYSYNFDKNYGNTNIYNIESYKRTA